MLFPREFPEPEELSQLLNELNLGQGVDFQKITFALRWAVSYTHLRAHET